MITTLLVSAAFIFTAKSMTKECDIVPTGADGCYHLRGGGPPICNQGVDQVNELLCDLGLTTIDGRRRLMRESNVSNFTSGRRNLMQRKRTKRAPMCPIFNVGNCPKPDPYFDLCELEVGDVSFCSRTGTFGEEGSCSELNDLSAFLCVLNNQITPTDNACECLQTLDGNQICANLFPCEVIDFFDMVCDNDSDCQQFQWFGIEWGCVDNCDENDGGCVPGNPKNGVCVPECFFPEPKHYY